MNYNLENLPEVKEGLALDIDETLAWTIGAWVENLQELFGNPESLSVHELIAKYRYTQNVPYWQTKEALDWMSKNINSNEFQTRLALMENANEIVGKIHKLIPITSYITTRPQTILEGTKIWLKKYGFPEAPIILRPSEIPSKEGNQWKAQVLAKLSPQVRGIVDDNIGLLKCLPDSYEGKVFVYSHKDIEPHKNGIPCPTWNDVYREVRRVFG